MLTVNLKDPLSTQAGQVQTIYHGLLASNPAAECVQNGQQLVDDCLAITDSLQPKLPRSPRDLPQWIKQNTHNVAQRYSEYRQQRNDGKPRRYFHSRSHALAFLRASAPTKLVDGSWLYPVMQHWRDSRFLPLISTYLEELGEGSESQNHVVMFKKLLTTYGCDYAPDLDDNLYLQGALQLSLGLSGDKYLPELIGYNLGYEQLPLHLLITAYEFEELGIDPHYFTVHVCSDNASTGHAHKAVQTVIDLCSASESGETSEFYQRVQRGFGLNDLGPGAEDIIQQFNLDSELVSMLQQKSEFGRNLHSDRCRLNGRTINDWLQQPDDIPTFLQTMQEHGWVKRHQDPAASKFWQVLEGPKAKMAGVFSPYEMQLMYDWIGGDWLTDVSRTGTCRADTCGAGLPPMPESNRTKFYQFTSASGSAPLSDIADPDGSLNSLRHSLQNIAPAQQVQRLIQWLSPHNHTTPAGLFAARRFTQHLYR